MAVVDIRISVEVHHPTDARPAGIQQTQHHVNVIDDWRGLEVSWSNNGRPLRLASGSRWTSCLRTIGPVVSMNFNTRLRERATSGTCSCGAARRDVARRFSRTLPSLDLSAFGTMTLQLSNPRTPARVDLIAGVEHPTKSLKGPIDIFSRSVRTWNRRRHASCPLEHSWIRCRESSGVQLALHVRPSAARTNAYPSSTSASAGTCPPSPSWKGDGDSRMVAIERSTASCTPCRTERQRRSRRMMKPDALLRRAA